jgi:hypothetical protein
MRVQPSEQVADLGGQTRICRISRDAVDPLVQPQPAIAGRPGQPDEETSGGAWHAAGQPDSSSPQVRREPHFPAYRFLVGLEE